MICPAVMSGSDNDGRAKTTCGWVTDIRQTDGIEGDERQTDARRGAGTYGKLTANMDRMREKGILPAEGAPLAAPGTILGVEDEALLVACGDGVYAFSRLCPAGKKPMSGRAFYNGYLAGASHALFALEG